LLLLLFELLLLLLLLLRGCAVGEPRGGGEKVGPATDPDNVFARASRAW